VREARRAPVDPPEIRLRKDRVAVGSARPPKGGAQVWLVRYDPRRQEVVVKDGDNRGQTVVERNIVAQIEPLGAWKGRPVLFKLPPAPAEGLATVVLLQGADGGRILASAAPAQP
jgi:hypothetical protein